MARKIRELLTPDEIKLKKVKSILGTDTVKEMEAILSNAELYKKITGALGAIDEAVEKRDENPDYQSAKYDVSCFNKGVNEIKKRQKATIAYAKHLLAARGQE